METRANHVLIGLFALIVSISGVLFALWAAKYASEKSFKEYDVVFIEAVTGLSNGSVVQYNGITVGEVRKLSLDRKDPNKVIARIRVEADTPVKIDTKAKLAFVGLTGVAQIQFSGGMVSSPDLKPEEGQDVAVIVAEESAIAKLLNSTEDITTTAADVLLRLNKMLSQENVDHITQTLAHLEAVTGTLDQGRGDLRELLSNARAASQKLDSTLAKTDRVMGKLDEGLIAQLPALVAKLDKSLTNIESLTRNADGLIGENRQSLTSFSNQGLTQVGPALQDLRNLIQQLNHISARLDQSPTEFVLGRGKPKEFKP